MTSILALTLTATLAGPAVPAATAPAVVASPPAHTSPASLLAQASRLAADAGRGPAARVPFASGAAARGAWTPGGDSLKNGAIIGGTIGGLAMGGFVGWLCYMLDETEGHGDCVKAALLWGGIGAAGGVALGAGVDALFDRPMAVVRVRFQAP